MPGHGRHEATRRLRALPQPPHVLILTSLSPSGTVERAVEAGAEGFDLQNRCTGGHHPPHHRCVRRSAAIQSIQPTALINDLNMQQPQSRRDEARAMLDALPERGTRGGGSRSRRVHQCRNRGTNVHFGTYRQGAHLIRGRQIMHGPGTDGAFVERADLPDQL